MAPIDVVDCDYDDDPERFLEDALSSILAAVDADLVTMHRGEQRDAPHEAAPLARAQSAPR